VLSYLDAAKKYIPALARKTDAVVVLGELPSAAIDTLVKLLPEIDLVISTGAVKAGETLQSTGKKTRVVGSGSSGYVGHNVVLNFGAAGRDSIAISASSESLTDVYDEPGTWKERLDAFNAQGSAASASPQPKSNALPTTTMSAQTHKSN
jgi:2',3'-cyclic-nucleotide 2'-phosphodiesterase (5'-nucleotidase family)